MSNNKSELLKLLKDFVEDNNEDIIHEFGNWRNAFDEVNISVFSIGEKNLYTDEDILNALRSFYQDYGDRISDGNYRKKRRKPSLQTIYKRFGSWNKALEKAGIPTRHAKRTLSEDEITEMLREAYKDVGEPFTTTKYDQWSKLRGGIHITTILKKFGSWKEALEKANIK